MTKENIVVVGAKRMLGLWVLGLAGLSSYFSMPSISGLLTDTYGSGILAFIFVGLPFAIFWVFALFAFGFMGVHLAIHAKFMVSEDARKKVFGK